MTDKVGFKSLLVKVQKAFTSETKSIELHGKSQISPNFMDVHTFCGKHLAFPVSRNMPLPR